MNTLLLQRFDRLEHVLCESPAVRYYHITYSAVTQFSGQIRVRASLVDGGLLEVFEYVTVSADGTLHLKKYRYHWQDAGGNLIRRWDTAAHHRYLPHAPHHVHLSESNIEGVAKPPDVSAVIALVEAHVRVKDL
jgi:hypothetical protein